MKHQAERSDGESSNLDLRVLEHAHNSSHNHNSFSDDSDLTFLHRLKLDAQMRYRSRRFLPFDECCKWVRANGMWKSQDEWSEWVDMGEDLCPYVPTRPDEYYSRLGVWRGWDFFLLGATNSDDDPRWPEGKGPVITR